VAAGVVGRFNKLYKNQNNNAGLNWWKIKYLKHVPYNTPGVYDLKGIKIHYRNAPEILHSLKEIFVEEIYNIKFDTDTPYILDCGANIGLATIYLKKQYPNAEIIAFEPDPDNFSILQKNIEETSWKNIELRNEAIWKEASTLNFKNDGTLGSKIDNSSKGSNDIQVKAIRLKNLLNRKIDFLKMDIEGAEYEVLKDCTDSLHNIQNMFVEFHGYFNKTEQLTEILEIIEKNGFSFYIKEATSVYKTPFLRTEQNTLYDLQLNIFCFKIN
jgi:FkbM family methyltransferase